MHGRNWRSVASGVGALTALAVCAGCGGGSAGGEDGDDAPDVGPDGTGDVEAEADSGGGDADIPAPCPAPIAEACPADAGYPSYPPYPPHPLPVLLRAADLGPGTRFVSLSQVLVLLAERVDGDSRTVIAIARASADELDFTSAARGELRLPPGSTLRPVAALANPADSAGTSLAGLVVLLCDDAGCALYGADLRFDEVVELAALPGGDVPVPGDMRGLWWSVGPAACAYGDGVHCFDGRTWTSPVPSDAAALLLNDMQSCTRFTVAVGDRGRTAMSAWPSWTDTGDVGIYPDWLTVACQGDSYLRAGRGGFVMDDSWILCHVADEDIVFLDAGGESGGRLLVGVTASGRVFIGEGRYSAATAFCLTGQTIGPVVDGAVGACGISYNHLLLTADTLYGTSGCAIEL